MIPRLTFLPEWVEQDLVLISWPNESMDWASRLPQIEACYKQMAESILAYEDLLILAKDPEHVRSLLSDREHKHELFIMEMDCNDTWCRDYAPLSLLLTDEEGNERPMIVDFTFNGWGMKFAADKDNLITRALYLSRAFVPETAYTNALIRHKKKANKSLTILLNHLSRATYFPHSPTALVNNLALCTPQLTPSPR